MKSANKILIAVIAIIVVIAIAIGGSYNKLVTLDQNVSKAESNIDTLLQRRSDLIPNLVSTVKGYATQEKDRKSVV
jgi:LemA protein